MTHREEFRAYMKADNRTSGSNDERHLTEAQVIAYCRNEMSAAEHEAAEAHLVWCEQCITLFRNARQFLEPARDDEQEITAAETDEAWRSLWQRVQSETSTNVPTAETTTVVSGDFQRGRDNPHLRDNPRLSRITLALAASLLISFAALGWQTWRLLSERQSRRQSQDTAMQLEEKQRDLEQRLAQVERNSDDQLKRERDQRLAAEADRDRLQDQLASVQQSNQEIPAYLVRLSSERGAGDDVRLRLTGVTKSARLRLLINKPYEFPEYAIELVNQDGRTVLQAAGLRPAGDDGALSLRFNRSSLSAGSYRLRLFGGKDRKQLGEYGISVTVDR